MDKFNEKCLNAYLNNLRQNNRSSLTILNYKKDLLQFLRWIEGVLWLNLKAIRPEHIAEYLQFLSGQKVEISHSFFKRLYHRQFQQKLIENDSKSLAINSRRRHLSCINNFFEFLVQSGGYKIKRNPVRNKIHSIKLKDSNIEHTKLMSEEQFCRVLESSRNVKDFFISTMLFYSGLRLSELCSLKLEDFDFSKGIITVIRKGGKRHQYALENFDFIALAMRKYCYAYAIGEGPLFPTPKGRVTERSMSGYIKRMLKRSELPELTVHSFRKGCATWLYKKTKDLLYVRNYLNHSDAKVTQSYIEI
ncbi:MAG: tyrosine-type recombinase/integrase [Halobacteriovoraceae bacterium]|nr:tyrosine-type recombinase/integrase [Halobacteriovoraceae bacterium]